MKTDNELIAEFMDEEISAVIANYGVPVRVLVLPRKPISETKTGRPIEAKYDTSWDWLMPVVEKIEYLGHTVHVAKNDVAVKERNTISSPSVCFIQGKWELTKIEAVYKAVVEFIKWYNNQK